MLFSNRFDRTSFDIKGGMVGGTFGAQIQQNYVVLGLEGDLDWADITGGAVTTPTVLGIGQGITLNVRSKIRVRNRKGEGWRCHGQLAVLRHGWRSIGRSQCQRIDCRRSDLRHSRCVAELLGHFLAVRRCRGFWGRVGRCTKLVLKG